MKPTKPTFDGAPKVKNSDAPPAIVQDAAGPAKDTEANKPVEKKDDAAVPAFVNTENKKPQRNPGNDDDCD